MDRFLPGRAAACALTSLALALGACDSINQDASEATGLTPGAARMSATGSRPANLHPNSQRYSDKGAKPATGRSGSATLFARALKAKDGSTVLEVSTGGLDGTGTPNGTLDRVQVKAAHPVTTNRTLFTQNYQRVNAASKSYSYANLARHNPIQVQANVRGADPSRNGVITVQTAVQLRPDVAVTVSAPEQVTPNMPVDMSAILTEINGDVGASGTCVLYIDGTVASRIERTWVDAMDVVSCAFRPEFATAGTHQVRVAFEDVLPGDFDTTNNASEATVTVAAAGPQEVEWFAEARSVNSTYDHEWRHPQLDGSGGALHGEDGERSLYESAAVFITAPTIDLVMPLDELTLSMTSGGHTLQNTTFTSFGAGWRHTGNPDYVSCMESQQNTAFGLFSFTVCSGRFGGTRIYYYRFAGSAVYWDSGYYSEAGYWSEIWSHTRSEYAPGLLVWGDTFSFTVSAKKGTRSVFVEAGFPLQSYSSSGSYTDTWDYGWWLDEENYTPGYIGFDRRTWVAQALMGSSSGVYVMQPPL